MANKKDKPVNFDLKFENLCKAVKYSWLHCDQFGIRKGQLKKTWVVQKTFFSKW